MTHQIASTEYIDGATWDITYCGIRSARAGTESSEGMALTGACPDCERGKPNTTESTLDGVPSSVYTAESVVPDGILLVEKELVNGNPLIGQERQWLVDPDDRSSKTLLRKVRHLDYRVVPKE